MNPAPITRSCAIQLSVTVTNARNNQPLKKISKF